MTRKIIERIFTIHNPEGKKIKIKADFFVRNIKDETDNILKELESYVDNGSIIDFLTEEYHEKLQNRRNSECLNSFGFHLDLPFHDESGCEKGNIDIEYHCQIL